MSSRPLVSIVTPSYNQVAFIEDNLKCVMRQNYPSIEHIVIDGGSTDGTLEVLRSYSRKYNLRWVSESDHGQSDAINKGFKMAKGDIIGWLNSDDMYYSTKVVSQVADEFAKFSDVAVVYGDNIYVDRYLRFLGLRAMPGWSYRRAVRRTTPSQPATFFRKMIVEKDLLRTDLHFNMDYEFWLRLGAKYRFRHVATVFAVDRVHQGAKRAKNRQAVELEARAILREYGENLSPGFYARRLTVDFPFVLASRLFGLRRIGAASDMALPFERPSKLNLVRRQFGFVHQEIMAWLSGDDVVTRLAKSR